MGFSIKNSSWTKGKGIFVKNGTWQSVKKGFVKTGGSWTQFYPTNMTTGVDPVLTTSYSGYNPLPLLSGSIHQIINATSVYYRYQISSDQVTWIDLSSDVAITNPTTTSATTSTSTTYQVLPTDFTQGTMYVWMIVTAYDVNNNSATFPSNVVTMTSPPVGSGIPTLTVSAPNLIAGVGTSSFTAGPTSTTYDFRYSATSATGPFTSVQSSTSTTYTPGSNLGWYQLNVTATNSIGTSTTPIQSAILHYTGNSDPGTISGTPAVGNVLTVVGTVSPTGLTPSYQWQRSTSGTSGFTNITGQTSSTYTVSADDQNLYLVCLVSWTGNSMPTPSVGPVPSAAVITASAVTYNIYGFTATWSITNAPSTGVYYGIAWANGSNSDGGTAQPVTSPYSHTPTVYSAGTITIIISAYSSATTGYG